MNRKQFRALEFRLRQLERELELAKAERDQYRGRLSAIESSKFWQLRNRWVAFKSQLLRRTPADWTPELPELPPLEPPDLRPQYEDWQQHYAPRPIDYQQMRKTVGLFPSKPLISLLVAVCNPTEAHLKAMLESVQAQIYSHWQICVTDAASTELDDQAILQAYAQQDDRIKIVSQPQMQQVAAASNAALALAAGEFVALLNPHDRLSPEALYEVALLLNHHPEADFIYSDEDQFDEQGRFSTPAFKPDWSPDSLLSRMYTGHLGVYRRSLVNQIGGFRVGYEGCYEYDLVLRLTEKTQNIFHIPKVLYHSRLDSPSLDAESSKSIIEPIEETASHRALADALERRGEPGKLLPIAGFSGQYIVRYQIREHDLVSIVIPTKDKADLLDRCLTSIFEKTTYPNYEVILIDNNSVEPKTAEVIQKWQTRFNHSAVNHAGEETATRRFQCHRLDIPFNYSRLNNFAVQQSNGKYLLFLNNDIEVITPDWMTATVEQAQRRSIGAVGALLLYPDDTIQHAGVVLGICAYSGHSHKHFPAEASGYLDQVIGVTNYSAVTGACLMCKRENFEAIGGFDENLAVSFNDIDLCLKLMERGLHNVYLPHVKLYHYESQSRGQDNTPEKRDRFLREANTMMQRWQTWMTQDPHYSPNLTIDSQDYGFRE